MWYLHSVLSIPCDGSLLPYLACFSPLTGGWGWGLEQEEGMGGNFKRVLKVITDKMKEEVGKLSRERCLKNKPMNEV